ncbi:MAG: hypothetical protein H7228_10605 [Polaromonas sp.]|nr:hypothetical protein [Polaromonas sp.]
MKYLQSWGKCLGCLCCLVAVSTACSLNPSAPEPAGYTTRIGGDSYVIKQLTASTWTATTAGPTLDLPASPKAKSELLDAIERSSGCKVTDSDYSVQGRQLDAQVDCDARQKNAAGPAKK